MQQLSYFLITSLHVKRKHLYIKKSLMHLKLQLQKRGLIHLKLQKRRDIV